MFADWLLLHYTYSHRHLNADHDRVSDIFLWWMSLWTVPDANKATWCILLDLRMCSAVSSSYLHMQAWGRQPDIDETYRGVVLGMCMCKWVDDAYALPNILLWRLPIWAVPDAVEAARCKLRYVCLCHWHACVDDHASAHIA